MKFGSTLHFGSSLLVLAFTALSAGPALASTYNGMTVGPARDGATYSVSPSVNDVINLNNPAGDMSGSIAVTFAKSLSGSFVVNSSMTTPTAASSSAPGKIYSYINVNENGFDNTSIQAYTWTFSVTQAWLTSQGLTYKNVYLYHFNSMTNAWETLPTVALNTTGSTYTFQAKGTSFSPFAIAGTSGLTNTGSSSVLYLLLAGGLIVSLFVAYKLNSKQK